MAAAGCLMGVTGGILVAGTGVLAGITGTGTFDGLVTYAYQLTFVI